MYETNEPPAAAPGTPPPFAPNAPAPTLTYALPGSMSPFQSPRSRANVAIALFGVWLVVGALSLVSSKWQLDLLTRVENGESITQADAETNDQRETALGLVGFANYVLVAIFYVRWLRRSRKNLEPLGVYDAQYSPGWAIGAWFVPFLNLVRPYQITQEIYRASGPPRRGSSNFGWQYEAGSALIKWWWFGWIVYLVMQRVSSRSARGGEDIQRLLFATRADMLATAVGMFAAVMCIAVIREITSRQEQRALGATIPMATVTYAG